MCPARNGLRENWECRAAQISAKATSTSKFWTEAMIELPGVREDGMLGRNGQRKPGTTRRGPLGRRATHPPWRCTIESSARHSAGLPKMTTKCTNGGCKPNMSQCTPGAGLSWLMRGKAPPEMPAFQPYRGKPAVRNDRESRGNDGIIRSPGSRLDSTRLRDEDGQPPHLLGRRNFLHLIAGAAALPAISRVAWAQTYPSRPVGFLVPFPAGGPSDVLARLIGQRLSERLGQPFIIENRPGATGNIATEAVARAPADGHTLLLVVPGNGIAHVLYDKLNFNFIRDTAPVAGISNGPLVMEVNATVPAQTVPEFIAYAKANPGKINFAS